MRMCMHRNVSFREPRTMAFGNIVLQSAGSLSVAILAFIMMILQTLFFFKRPRLTWYAWSAAGSFSALLYSAGIFIEYNTPAGPLNRFSGILEFMAIICLVHSIYGFTFSYLGIESRRYHTIAGIFHGLLLILLWSTHYIVSQDFTVRHFMGLASPYVEPALGPLGPFFMLYAAIAGINSTIIWIRSKHTEPKHRRLFLSGMAFWTLLGIHDGLAAMGLPTFQFLMEYGFLGFAMVVLWVVFDNYSANRAEEKYHVITEFANDCILVIQDGKAVFNNLACHKLLSSGAQSSAAVDFFDLLRQDDRTMLLNHYNRLLKGVPERYPHTFTIDTGKGKERFVEIASNLIQYGDRPAILAIMRDMTEGKRVEAVLRESEEKYRSMMEAMTDFVYICSSDFRITDMNPFMIRKLGHDFTGEICHKAFYDRGEPCPWCVFDKMTRCQGVESEFVSPKDGRTYTVTHSPIFHRDGSVSRLTISRDITETKHLQHQILRSERLSATGQLAGTIAHEINSPLQGITSLLNSIEKTHQIDDLLSKKLSLVKDGFMRIHKTVRTLLELNRPGKEIKQPTDVNRVIEDTLELLKSYIRKHRVGVILNLSPEIPTITASPQQLRQVFMNLIANAVEAIADASQSADGGKGMLNTNGKITVCTRLENDAILLQFIDTGPGIPEEDVEQIFAPFFTRKREMGMGIGLSLCHGIIEDHKGTITVENAPHGGASFEIVLPLTSTATQS